MALFSRNRKIVIGGIAIDLKIKFNKNGEHELKEASFDNVAIDPNFFTNEFISKLKDIKKDEVFNMDNPLHLKDKELKIILARQKISLRKYFTLEAKDAIANKKRKLLDKILKSGTIGDKETLKKAKALKEEPYGFKGAVYKILKKVADFNFKEKVEGMKPNDVDINKYTVENHNIPINEEAYLKGQELKAEEKSKFEEEKRKELHDKMMVAYMDKLQETIKILEQTIAKQNEKNEPKEDTKKEVSTEVEKDTKKEERTIDTDKKTIIKKKTEQEPEVEGWIVKTSGYAKLSEKDKIVAEKNYKEWKENREKDNKDVFSIEEYVDYVQTKHQERLEQSDNSWVTDAEKNKKTKKTKNQAEKDNPFYQSKEGIRQGMINFNKEHPKSITKEDYKALDDKYNSLKDTSLPLVEKVKQLNMWAKQLNETKLNIAAQALNSQSKEESILSQTKDASSNASIDEINAQFDIAGENLTYSEIAGTSGMEAFMQTNMQVNTKDTDKYTDNEIVNSAIVADFVANEKSREKEEQNASSVQKMN